MIRTLLLVLLVLILVGAFPTWPYSTGWGYFPSCLTSCSGRAASQAAGQLIYWSPARCCPEPAHVNCHTSRAAMTKKTTATRVKTLESPVGHDARLWKMVDAPRGSMDTTSQEE